MGPSRFSSGFSVRHNGYGVRGNGAGVALRRLASKLLPGLLQQRRVLQKVNGRGGQNLSRLDQPVRLPPGTDAYIA